QLLEPEGPGFEEAEDAPPKTQQASNSRELDEQLTALEQTFAQLSIQFSQAGRDLTALGSLPSDKIIEDLTAARTAFVDLRNKLLDLANFLAISSLPEPDEILTLQDLRLLLYEVAQAEEKRPEVEQICQGALRVLDRVSALVYRKSGDSSSFPPLAQCQAEAQELRHAVADACRPSLHPDAAALDEGKHKFADPTLLRCRCIDFALPEYFGGGDMGCLGDPFAFWRGLLRPSGTFTIRFQAHLWGQCLQGRHQLRGTHAAENLPLVLRD